MKSLSVNEKEFIGYHDTKNFLNPTYVDKAISLIEGVTVSNKKYLVYSSGMWEEVSYPDKAMAIQYSLIYKKLDAVLTMLDQYKFYYDDVNFELDRNTVILRVRIKEVSV